MRTVEGGCHCGLVRFEADLPDGPVTVETCNCSICTMTGYQHVMVPSANFRLVEGRRDTTTYRFGSGTAQHIFCTQCGIKSFYRPRSNPDAYSVDFRCLDEGHGLETVAATFDGKHHPGRIA
jgi:hypothetical protein